MSVDGEAMAGAEEGPDVSRRGNNGDPLPPDVGPDDPAPDDDGVGPV